MTRRLVFRYMAVVVRMLGGRCECILEFRDGICSIDRSDGRAPSKKFPMERNGVNQLELV